MRSVDSGIHWRFSGEAGANCVFNDYRRLSRYVPLAGQPPSPTIRHEPRRRICFKAMLQLRREGQVDQDGLDAITVNRMPASGRVFSIQCETCECRTSAWRQEIMAINEW